MPADASRRVQSLHESSPDQVPHVLPDEYALAALIADLPLRMLQYVDLPDLYLATLQVLRACSHIATEINGHSKVASNNEIGSKAKLGNDLHLCKEVDHTSFC